ncbi:MAG: hypothetical protein NZ534_04445, partial [Bacteroidia bacterium]|nr:hypothetical protein [Bacteroidia bacterium]
MLKTTTYDGSGNAECRQDLQFDFLHAQNPSFAPLPPLYAGCEYSIVATPTDEPGGTLTIIAPDGNTTVVENVTSAVTQTFAQSGDYVLRYDAPVSYCGFVQQVVTVNGAAISGINNSVYYTNSPSFVATGSPAGGTFFINGTPQAGTTTVTVNPAALGAGTHV